MFIYIILYVCFLFFIYVYLCRYFFLKANKKLLQICNISDYASTLHQYLSICGEGSYVGITVVVEVVVVVVVLCMFIIEVEVRATTSEHAFLN